jgi:nucleoid-associated protein YgaU
MKKEILFYLFGLCFIVILSGCVVRTYPLTKERVDQDLTMGNRGYMQGEAPAGEVTERKATRTTQMIEIELHSPIRFERMPKEKKYAEEPTVERKEDKEVWGNRGYITESSIPETAESAPSVPNVEKYTVQKGDTLQKISQKFYGTTKKWNKIYEANKETLKGPNKIYPGQVIDVPVSPERGRGVEPLREPQENLK